jgi:hypothetical protein
MNRAAREQQAELEFSSRIRADLPMSALCRLARDASARNATRGVTGEMCLEDGRIRQVIEGSCDTILVLAAAILSDWRHEGIDVRNFRLIEARRFARWRVRGIDASPVFCALRVSAQVDLGAPAPGAWAASLGETADRRA